MKIAYIEFNLVHDEIQPMFQYIAEKLGHTIDFYIPEINASRNVFCKCEKATIHLLKYENPHRPISSPPLDLESRWTSYGLIIMGTGEPYDRIQKFERIAVKNKVMIVHNYNHSYKKAPFKTILLANFIKDNFNALNSLVITPFYCGEVAATEKLATKIFCVQGNFQSKKRNYNSLVEAVLRLKLSGFSPTDFKIEIIGRYNRKDIKWHDFGTEGADFDNIIHKLGIATYFNRPDKEYLYPEYLEKMVQSRYILPLIDDTHSHQFFNNSCTSSINLGIACLCIPVLNQKLATLYGIDFGYIYEKKDLFSAMKIAITTIDDDVLEKVVQYKNKHLEQSVRNFNDTFGNIV